MCNNLPATMAQAKRVFCCHSAPGQVNEGCAAAAAPLVAQVEVEAGVAAAKAQRLRELFAERTAAADDLIVSMLYETDFAIVQQSYDGEAKLRNYGDDQLHSCSGLAGALSYHLFHRLTQDGAKADRGPLLEAEAPASPAAGADAGASLPDSVEKAAAPPRLAAGVFADVGHYYCTTPQGLAHNFTIIAHTVGAGDGNSPMRFDLYESDANNIDIKSKKANGPRIHFLASYHARLEQGASSSSDTPPPGAQCGVNLTADELAVKLRQIGVRCQNEYMNAEWVHTAMQ